MVVLEGDRCNEAERLIFLLDCQKQLTREYWFPYSLGSVSQLSSGTSDDETEMNNILEAVEMQ